VSSRLELRPAERCCQLGPGERVLQHQDPFARAEVDLDLVTLLDLFPHHRSFLTPHAQRPGSEQREPPRAVAGGCWPALGHYSRTGSAGSNGDLAKWSRTASAVLGWWSGS